MDENKNYLWGVDLGGTKIEGVVIRKGDNPEILARERIPTEREKGYNHIIRQIEKLIGQLKKATGLEPERLGIGVPGTIDKNTRRLKNCNTTVLIEKPFREDLEKSFSVPVRMANDANCFALAEAKFGAAYKINPKAEVVFGVIMGTGVGGGIVVNGEIIEGLQGIAGEWGHNFLDESGGKCYCGRIGCVETVISGPALERYYQSLTGKELKLDDISRLHEENADPYATQTIDRLTYFFGRAIAYVINIIDPEIILLGGGVGNVSALYKKGVEETQKHVFNLGLETKFVKPELGDSAGVIGAAFL